MNIVKLISPKKDLVYLTENNSVRQAIERLKIHRYSSVPILSVDGVYLASISEGDFLYFLFEGEYTMEELENINIMDLVKKDPKGAITVRASVEEVYLRILNSNYVPVTDDRGYFMGIIKRRDFIASLKDNLDKLKDFAEKMETCEKISNNYLKELSSVRL